MFKKENIIVLEESDTKFLVNKYMRNLLEEYKVFSNEIYTKVCKELYLDKLPISFKYFLNIPGEGKTSAGVTYGTLRGNILEEFTIGISLTHAKRFDHETYYETTPHETSHAINALIDWNSFLNDGHGRMWEDVNQVVMGYFPEAKILPKFTIVDWEEDQKSMQRDFIEYCSNKNLL